MYYGWLSFAGTEVINTHRTVAYVREALPALGIKHPYESPFIEYAIQEPTNYTNPVADEAPWYDPGAPETADFLGFYTTDMMGFTDGTGVGTSVEGAGDGGVIYGARHRTREMRVVGQLIGRTQEGAEAGLTWLRAVLQGSNCNDNCGGDEVCFLVAPPVSADRGDSVVRKAREVSRISGPTVLREFPLSCGGWMIEVEYLLSAGSPWLYGEPVLVAAAEGTNLATYIAGATIDLLAYNLSVCGGWEGPGSVAQRALPIVDPDCPPLPSPPTVPSPTQICADVPTDYQTYAIYVPDDQVHEWKDGVLQLRITNGNKAMRFARIRLLPRPLATQQVVDLDPCSACGDIMISYFPAGATITLDGMTERSSIVHFNRTPVSANHLLTGTAGEIPEWPIFTCGLGYYVLVEVPNGTSLAGLTLNIANRE